MLGYAGLLNSSTGYLECLNSGGREMVAYIANTLIFILSGVVIAESFLGSDGTDKTNEYSWGYLFLLYVVVQVSRVVIVVLTYLFFFVQGWFKYTRSISDFSGLRRKYQVTSLILNGKTLCYMNKGEFADADRFMLE